MKKYGVPERFKQIIQSAFEMFTSHALNFLSLYVNNQVIHSVRNYKSTFLMLTSKGFCFFKKYYIKKPIIYRDSYFMYTIWLEVFKSS